jgi:hypothetical protein
VEVDIVLERQQRKVGDGTDQPDDLRKGPIYWHF